MKIPSSPQQSIQLADFCTGLQCTRALTLCQLEDAFQLIHSSYSQRGFILPNHAGMWMNRHHLLASTRLFLAVEAMQSCGTLTLVDDGPLGVPMETIFRREVQQCRVANGTIAEATCLALTAPGSSNSLKVVNHLMGIVAQAARKSGIRQILITVHPRHARYYVRMAGFKTLGPPQAYPAVRGHLAIPLALHLPSLSKVCPAAYSRYFGMQFSEPALANHQTPNETLNQLAIIWRSIQRDLQEKLSKINIGTTKVNRTAA